MHVIVFLGATRRHLDMYGSRPSDLYQQSGCCCHQVNLIGLLCLILLIWDSRLVVAVMGREIHIIGAHQGGSWFWFWVLIGNLPLCLQVMLYRQVARSIGVDIADMLADNRAAPLADHDHLFLESVAVAMGADFAQTPMLARGSDSVLFRVGEPVCDSDGERCAKVPRCGPRSFNLFPQDAKLFGTVGQVIQEGILTLPGHFADLPGFNGDQALLIGSATEIGLGGGAKCDLMARGHNGGWHGQQLVDPADLLTQLVVFLLQDTYTLLSAVQGGQERGRGHILRGYDSRGAHDSTSIDLSRINGFGSCLRGS